ncbi:septal ring lytic transglycosylase RlpA family protein [Streptomonospora algeriensis]|uniref:Probable endolytic peptidoglycan transglycosylase RlpA n=1 Tax=Streptomonospora algeriensis TaxID=995084 RepID=A0ABW3BL33_9ACTN
MGNHQPARARLRERLAEKRSLLVVTATGAALIAAGTAGAATVDTLTSDPGAASQQVAPPAAKTADSRLAPAASASSEPQQGQADTDQAERRHQQALEAATQSLSGTTRQEKADPEPAGASGSGGASGGADLGPTGQGGSCEASMYSEPQPTASGERFDPSAMTAAHKTLPMDTMVEVTNPDNGTSVTVRINDRGPYIAGRCLDLSTASFEQIASASAGVVDVRWQVLS